MDKKYTKTKKQEKKSADGTENAEHILDLTHEIDMMYSNIKDNTDICIDLYKFKKSEGNNDDILDATQLVCEKIIELEKTASEFINLVKIDAKNEQKLKEIHSKMKTLEESSKKLLESIID